MNEEEPSLPLIGGSEPLIMTAHNSQLFTFVGRSALEISGVRYEVNNNTFNHVWVANSEESGIYFWEQYDTDLFRIMSTFIIENSFPAYLNSRNVSQYDVKAWLIEIDDNVQKFRNSIPDVPEI